MGLGIILAASIALQVTAAALALRLIRVTGLRLAWGLFAAAMVVMAVPRCLTLYRLLSDDLARAPELWAELTALVIALLMVTGVALIAPRLAAARRAEPGVGESEERFRDFAETASDWFWETDENLRFTYFSDRFGKVGLEADETLGKTRLETTAEDTDQPKWREHVADLEARRPFKGFQHAGVARDGSLVHMSVSGTPVFDEGGVFKGYRGTATDITARKTAEAALAARDRRQMAVAQLRQLALSNPDLDAVIDEAVAAVAATLAVEYCKVLELLPEGEEFLLRAGVGWKEGSVGRATVAAGTGSQAGYTLLSKEPVIVEDLGNETRFSGPSLLLEHGVRSGLSLAIEGEEGPFGVLGAHTTERREFSRDDVHFLQAVANVLAEAIERKRTEDALRESEARLQAILDYAPAIIYLKDIEGRYLVVNREFEKTYGVTNEDIVGTTVHDVFDPGVSDAYLDFDRRVLESGAPVERELPDPYFAGESTLMVSKFPVTDGDGAIVAIGGVEIDITDIKRIEQQLVQAQKMEAVGQLTGGVAHDFNNLLAVILGNLELLEERLDGDADSADLAQRAAQAASRGALLTQRLLAFSRKQVLQPRVIDLNALVPGMTELLRRTLGETIEIETVLAGGLWRTLVDPAQLESALLNLAVNARDAMTGGGKLTIETANARLDEEGAADMAEAAPGEYVVLAVGDSGRGMPPDIVERAFEPFFTTKEIGRGSGLGLSMVYGFVKQSGGHVKMHSRPGRGTTVKIYLPRSRQGAAEETGARAAAPEHMGEGETVMVVEDDAAVRQYAVALLTRLGYHAVEAADGASALEALERTPQVALLFCDVVLPGAMTGADLAREAQRRRPGLKVLFTSGYTVSAMARHGGVDAGAELIEKPYRMAPLARKLRAVLVSQGVEP